MKEQGEKFELKKIMAAISPSRRCYLEKIDIFQSIASTNTYLLAQLKPLTVAQSGWVCLAEQQTQGRGRQGKEWFSPPGTNIYCSLSWCFSPAFEGLSALGIATAVMIIKVLKGLGLREELGLKWPNDIVVSGRKLSGILLENLATIQQNKVVVGIGLNLVLPAEKRQSWVGLSEILEKPITRNDLAGLLLDGLLTDMPLFEAKGLQPFLPMYRQHDALYGKKILVSTALSQYTGFACGINEAGELIIEDDQQQRHRLAYGEVSTKLVI